jgi:hypothetical protein
VTGRSPCFTCTLHEFFPAPARHGEGGLGAGTRAASTPLLPAPSALSLHQHEVAWFKNTKIGYNEYCTPSCLSSPECIGSPACAVNNGSVVAPVSSGPFSDRCCDPRQESRFYPPVKGRREVNYIRATLSAVTLVLCEYGSGVAHA